VGITITIDLKNYYGIFESFSNIIHLDIRNNQCHSLEFSNFNQLLRKFTNLVSLHSVVFLPIISYLPNPELLKSVSINDPGSAISTLKNLEELQCVTGNLSMDSILSFTNLKTLFLITPGYFPFYIDSLNPLKHLKYLKLDTKSLILNQEILFPKYNHFFC
jgi:hypothetical protein